MNEIVVVTTFADHHFEPYAKGMIQSFVQYWPKDISLLIQLDDDLLYDQVGKLLRPNDAIAIGWNQDHRAFVERNKGKDNPTNYRHQVTRFCHKVFSIKRVLDAIRQGQDKPRYLIWLDADVHTTRPVTIEEIKACLPKEDAAVSYLGRKDWPHSECGWIAFDIEKGGGEFIDVWHGLYTSDHILSLPEWHDSWAFDHVLKSDGAPQSTNLTEDRPGTEIWEQSPMAPWSIHYKGPVAKTKLQEPQMQRLVIQTQNAIPNENIKEHIATNQILIKNWVTECLPTEEEIVVVSAGPTLIAEDVRKETGRVVAVKHALEPLKKAGIKPWACILLDPRPHVADFVKEPDTDVIWFVASQVDPKVTLKLLEAGCTVWGYHAAVGAGEDDLTSKQLGAVIHGGSATATRGLFLLRHLGFRNFTLYGYDLSFPDKPDLKLTDNKGQPKYIEATVDITLPQYSAKVCFWSEPQLLAQYEEFNQLLNSGLFNIKAYGNGLVPILVKAKEVSNLRVGEIQAKMHKHESYESLLWNKTKKTTFLTIFRNLFRLRRPKTSKKKQS